MLLIVQNNLAEKHMASGAYSEPILILHPVFAFNLLPFHSNLLGLSLIRVVNFFLIFIKGIFFVDNPTNN